MKTMKITLIPLLLLSVLGIKSLLEGAYDSPHQVVDTSGNNLKVGANYYIIPNLTTKCSIFSKYKGNNGLVLEKVAANKTFPLDVLVVEGQQLGQPLTFTPIRDQKKGAPVRVSTDLNIEFSMQTSCSQSNVWKIDHFDRARRKWFVTTGGVVGHPSWRTIGNWFKIEKYDGDYKLVSCPTFCAYCKVQCRDIGVYEDQNGNKRLALTDAPYKVQFQKA